MATLRAIRPAADAKITPGSLAMRLKSSDMPMAMKNSPSNRPSKGRILASMSWRYSESARSVPAMKAPSAGDRPTPSMIITMTTMARRMRAVIASLTPVRATSL